MRRATSEEGDSHQAIVDPLRGEPTTCGVPIDGSEPCATVAGGDHAASAPAADAAKVDADTAVAETVLRMLFRLTEPVPLYERQPDSSVRDAVAGQTGFSIEPPQRTQLSSSVSLIRMIVECSPQAGQ
jgi:hypothetical protein